LFTALTVKSCVLVLLTGRVQTGKIVVSSVVRSTPMRIALTALISCAAPFALTLCPQKDETNTRRVSGQHPPCYAQEINNQTIIKGKFRSWTTASTKRKKAGAKCQQTRYSCRSSTHMIVMLKSHRLVGYTQGPHGHLLFKERGGIIMHILIQ
jgi:hypothetical protein